MKNLLADFNLTPDGFRGIGPLGLEGVSDPANSIKTFNKIISSAVGLMSIIAGLWFIFVLISGAIAVISAGGDKGKIEEAKGRITSGLIGIVVTIASLFIIDVIGKLIGFDILGGALKVNDISP